MADAEFALPDFACPFPQTFNQISHPAADELELELLALLHGIDHEHRSRAALDGTRFGDLVGRIVPRASRDGLRLAMMASAMFYLNETWFDRRDQDGHMRSPDELVHTYTQTMEVMSGRPATSQDAALARFAEHFRKALDDFRPDWRTLRLLPALRRYLFSHLWELDHLRHHTVSPLPIFLDLRMHNEMATTFREVCTIACGVIFARRPHHEPAIEELERLSDNYLSWESDLFGLAKELREDTTTNLVLALRQELGGSLQQAVDAAVKMTLSQAHAYYELRSRLPAMGIAITPDLGAHLTFVEEYSGNASAWNRNVPRFREEYGFPGVPVDPGGQQRRREQGLPATTSSAAGTATLTGARPT